MKKAKNRYRITLDNGYLIIRKEPSKLTKAQKDYLASNGFNWETDRSASQKIVPGAINNAWKVGLQLNATCEEAVLDMFRKEMKK